MTLGSTNGKSCPTRETRNLRKGRISLPHARYFLTITTQQRKCGLVENPGIEALTLTLRSMQMGRDIDMHCATIMPDHMHLLFTLGTRLSLAQIVRKFKTQTKQPLEAHRLCWQDNFFEHRIRPEVPMEAFTRYIYLNPYRKNLLRLNSEWLGWILNRNYRPEFSEHLIEGKYPQPAWIDDDPAITQLLESCS